MSLFNDPIFNSLLTALIVYLTYFLTTMGFPLLGAILSTFPIGIMALLTIENSNLVNNLIQNLMVGNIIIVITWLVIFLNSKNNNVNNMAIIGLSTWLLLNLLYLLYINFIN